MGKKYKLTMLLAAALLLCSCAFGAPAGKNGAGNKKTSTAAPAHDADPETVDFSVTEPEYCLYEKVPRIFDSAPVAKAYKSGDSSSLTQTEKAILAKAAEVIDTVVTEGMTDYEKELAVHDYIITHSSYDAGTLAAIPNPSKNCEDPYGTLIDGSAICLGYTTTFRLFMDMLDIPCETVYAKSGKGNDHAWNIVTINGSKYYVDVTWDDPVPEDTKRFAIHDYFNVSRDYMVNNNHIMPEDCPETPSLDDTYGTRELVDIPAPENKEELTALIKSFGDRQKREIIFIPEADSIWQTALKHNKSGDLYFGDEVLLPLKECCADAGYCYAFAANTVETSKGTAVRFCIQYADYMSNKAK